jgi:hypothetical protein
MSISTTSSTPGGSRRLMWLPAVALLVIIGGTAGYLLPSGESPASADRVGVEQTAIAHASTPSSVGWLHEFPLSAEDVRDTQEMPAIAIDGAGRIALAWASKDSAASRRLLLTTSANRGRSFSDPRTIASSGIFKSGGGTSGRGGHERRMLPRMMFGGDSIALAWCDAPLDGSSVRMLIAQSRDGGQSFTDPAAIHFNDAARPTFTSLSANESGHIAASWLDCRHGPQQVFAAVRRAGSERFDEDAVVFAGENEQGVCPCCPTASHVTRDGVVLVAYRSQVDGYRDIWICRHDPEQAGFTTPMPVVPPTWKFDGCPHDGPSLAVSGETVHVAWMAAHSGRQRAYYGRAKLADMKFQVQELNAPGPGTQGNVALRVDAAGCLHALWEESLADEPAVATSEGGAGDKASEAGAHQHGPPAGAGRVVMYAFSPQADGRFSRPVALRPQPGRFQMRPAIACGTDGLIVAAWMELDEKGKRVVVASLKNFEQVALSNSVRAGN